MNTEMRLISDKNLAFQRSRALYLQAKKTGQFTEITVTLKKPIRRKKTRAQNPNNPFQAA